MSGARRVAGSGASEAVCTTVFAGLGLAALAAAFQPLPVPAPTALAGGLIAHWLGWLGAVRNRHYAATIAGAALGAIPGALIHGYLHYAEGRMEPDEGLVVHVVLDATGGVVLAGFALALAILLSRLVVRRIAPHWAEQGDP